MPKKPPLLPLLPAGDADGEEVAPTETVAPSWLSFAFSVVPTAVLAGAAAAEATPNSSPAPSQSLEVRIGVLTRANPCSSKNLCTAWLRLLLSRSIAALCCVRGRMWQMSRRNSLVWACRGKRRGEGERKITKAMRRRAMEGTINGRRGVKARA